MRVSLTELWIGRLVLITLMLFTFVPFVSLVTTSLHYAGATGGGGGSAPSGIDWPANPQWGNFLDAFNLGNIGPLIASSLIIVAGTVPITLAISTMAGFAIGQLRIPGANLLLLLFIFGLTLPFEGIITPLYYLCQRIGILNTRLAIILPLIGLYMPFAVFWLRAHFATMPAELSEAARVDGAGTWDLFWRIHVPLARPAIVSLGILLSVWTWNQFLLAIVLVDNPSQRTVAGAIGAFQGQWNTNYPLLCAATLLILLPTVIFFVVFQRQVIASLLQGSVKG